MPHYSSFTLLWHIALMQFTCRSPDMGLRVIDGTYVQRRSRTAHHYALPFRRGNPTMTFTRMSAATAAAAALVLALSACASNEGGAGAGNPDGPQLSGQLAGSGASSQGTAQTTWIAGYQGQQPGVQINYAGGGSGAGRTDFQNGTSQFVGSDRAFKVDEIKEGGFAACADGSDLVEIPAYISPIAIAFNLEGVDSLNLDAETIAGIFAGDIKKWNAQEIASQNPDAKLPDLAITPVHRSDKSGTTGNFTAYLDSAAPKVWKHGEVEEWPVQGGEAAQETPGVQNAIRAGNGTIGYLDNSAAGEFSKVKVKVGEEYVELTSEAAAAVIDNSTLEEGRADTDLVFKINRDADGIYPIVLVSYLIGCAKYADAATGELVKSYFSYVVSEQGQLAAEQTAHSAPMSSALRQQAQAAIDQIG